MFTSMEICLVDKHHISEHRRHCLYTCDWFNNYYCQANQTFQIQILFQRILFERILM